MKKRVDEKMKMRIRVFSLKSRTHGIVFGAVLSYMFWGSLLLLRAGDVESNPGPVERGDKSTAGLRQTRFSSSGRIAEKAADSGNASTALQPAVQGLSLEDVMAKLDGMDASMNGKLDRVKEDVRDIKEKFSVLEGDVNLMREEISALREENKETKRQNCVLRDRVGNLEKKVDDLEGRSKRNNLIFYGLEREERERDKRRL